MHRVRLIVYAGVAALLVVAAAWNPTARGEAAGEDAGEIVAAQQGEGVIVDVGRLARPLVPGRGPIVVPGKPAPPENWYPFEFNGQTYYIILLAERGKSAADDRSAAEPARDASSPLRNSTGCDVAWMR